MTTGSCDVADGEEARKAGCIRNLASSKSLRKRPYLRCVYPQDLPMLYDMVERAQRGDSHFEYEHRLVMPDNSVKHLQLIAHAGRDDQGELEYIGAIQDVTRRRLAEEELERARSDLAHVARVATMSALTASIAHEINQPLSGIITHAGTCLRTL